jgi:hypothetical protein
MGGRTEAVACTSFRIHSQGACGVAISAPLMPWSRRGKSSPCVHLRLDPFGANPRDVAAGSSRSLPREHRTSNEARKGEGVIGSLVPASPDTVSRF